MSLFQWVALAVIVVLIALSIAAMLRGRASLREGCIWVVVELTAGLTIKWPEVTQSLAKQLGIGRGKDLVFYSAILAAMIGFFMVYVRLRRVRSDLTFVVRHLAIRDAVVTGAADSVTHGAASEPKST